MIYLFSLSELTGFQAAGVLLVLPLLAFGLGKIIWGSYKKRFYNLKNKMEGYKTRTASLEEQLKEQFTKITQKNANLEEAKLNMAKSKKQYEAQNELLVTEIADLNDNLLLLKGTSIRVTDEDEQKNKQNLLDMEVRKDKYEAEVKGYKSRIDALEASTKKA